MNTRRVTLLEVLFPRCVKSNALRAKVTKTVIQPDIDAFEQAEEGLRCQAETPQNVSSRACQARESA